MAYLGLIPARGGSKGLPGKNMRMLGGRPMLQYTIEAALGSKRLDRVLLTSDDEEMIALARQLGCSAPFVRPAHLATDTSPILDTVLHALDWINQHESLEAENLVLLQPSAPFRDSQDIDAAIAKFEAVGADTLISVDPVMQHPCECISIEDGKLHWAVPPPKAATGRQAFAEFFFINGAIYIVRVPFLRDRGVFQDEKSAVHVMASSHGLDINNLYEFNLARGLLALAQHGEPVLRAAPSDPMKCGNENRD